MNKIRGNVNVIICDDTEAPRQFDELAAFRDETLVHRPDGDSEAVVFHSRRKLVIDTAFGNIIEAGHAVIDFLQMVFIGGGTVAQAFGRETRIGIEEDTTVGTLYTDTTVFEEDADVSGSADTIVIGHLPDQSATATWFQKIITQFLDPRHIFKTKGGICGCARGIGSPTYLAKDQDSGGIHTVVSGSGGVITIPADAMEGFDAVYVHGDDNPGDYVEVQVSSPGALLSSTGVFRTAAKGEALRVRYIGPGYFLVTIERGP